MKAIALLLLLPLAACAPDRPAITRTGLFAPGGTIAIRNTSGDVNAYAPQHDQPSNQFTISAYGARPAIAATSIRLRPLLITASTHAPGVRFLVRGPAGSSLDISTARGNINVADFEGIVDAHTGIGDIKMLIPLYGSASIGRGNMSVIFAATDWPGTLRFTVDSGNVELYVNENAKARVRLHTDDGTVYSDFDIRGTSSGTAETIVSAINGGGPRGIDVEVRKGSVRLMQLKPQI